MIKNCKENDGVFAATRREIMIERTIADMNMTEGGARTVDVDPRGRPSLSSPSVYRSCRRRKSAVVREARCETTEPMRRADRAASMTLRGSRRDSDVVLSNFGHKEHLFKFLVIGDYGVGESQDSRVINHPYI